MTDPVWASNPAFESGAQPSTQDPSPGVRPSHISERRYDGEERWVDLHLPEKMTVRAANDLVERLREANIRFRRVHLGKAGLFRPRMVRMKLEVPETTAPYATRLADECLKANEG